MTEFTVKHTCGHEVFHTHEGTDQQLRQREELLATLPCPDCRKERSSRATEERRQALNLPALEGSAQDIAWAEVIRQKAITQNRDFHKRLVEGKKLSQEDEAMKNAIVSAANEALKELENQQDAAWWIANHFDSLKFVKSRVAIAITPILESRK